MINERKLVVISGPSGCGKDTVSMLLSDLRGDIYISISVTTRDPRGSEQNGVEYYFISHEEFEKLLRNGGILEYTNYAGNYYGTPMDDIEQKTNKGKTVILVIDTNGGANIKKMFPDSLSVFIMPPSLDVLENRLRKRGTETEEQIDKRIAIAQKELEQAKLYDYSLVNDNLEACVHQLSNIIDNWQNTKEEK